MKNSSVVICICFWWADYAREDHTWKNTTLLHTWTQWQVHGREGKWELETTSQKLGMRKNGRTSYRIAPLWSEMLVAFKEKNSLSHTKSWVMPLEWEMHQMATRNSIFFGQAEPNMKCNEGLAPRPFSTVDSVNKHRISELWRQLLLLNRPTSEMWTFQSGL